MADTQVIAMLLGYWSPFLHVHTPPQLRLIAVLKLGSVARNCIYEGKSASLVWNTPLP